MLHTFLATFFINIFSFNIPSFTSAGYTFSVIIDREKLFIFQ